MNNKYNDIRLAVICGDMRMLYCARELAGRGFEVGFYGFENTGADCGDAVRCRTVEDAVKGASAVILPVPLSRDGVRVNAPFCREELRLDRLINLIQPTQLVLAGVCRPSFLSAAEESSLTVVDYMKDEELTVKNAVTTAEGTLELAMRELPVTVNGLQTLVLGYGRVGKTVAAAFSALNAKVTVCARRTDALAWAFAAGHETAKMKDICRAVQGKALIINTVPAQVLDNNVLSFADKDALVIDLASAPGGVDIEAAFRLGIKTVHALSLPGKTAPLTAGTDIADAAAAIMERRGVI